MRPALVLLATCAVLAAALPACGGGDSATGPTACEVGPEIYRAALTELFAEKPSCSRDEDCVVASTDVFCTAGYEVSGCGSVMHRQLAAKWNAEAVCEKIDAASVPSELACSVQARCIEAGRPACVAGSCVGQL